MHLEVSDDHSIETNKHFIENVYILIRKYLHIISPHLDSGDDHSVDAAKRTQTRVHTDVTTELYIANQTVK